MSCLMLTNHGPTEAAECSAKLMAEAFLVAGVVTTEDAEEKQPP